MININPKRMSGEKFKAYRARLREASAAIKRYLRGTIRYAASEIVIIPVLGADLAADHAVLGGQLRDVQDVTLTNGKESRVGRTKGVAFKRDGEKIRHGQGRARRRGLTFPDRPVVPQRDAIFDGPNLRQRIGMLINGSPAA